MKKGKKIVLLFLMSIFVFQGCTEITMDSGEIIVPPNNKKIAIEGTWKITYDKFFGDKTFRREKDNKHFGRIVTFNEDVVVFGDEVYNEPKYKMKRVDSRDYFIYEYKINYGELGIIGKTVEVISITSKDKHIYDFIRVNNKRLLVYIDHVFYYLDKVSEDTEKTMTGKEGRGSTQVNKEVLKEEQEIVRSGILLGLRAPNRQLEEGNQQTANTTEQNYRTLWIASKNKSLYAVMETSDILLPRKSGFWILGMKRQFDNGFLKDSLFAHPVKDTLNTISEKNKRLDVTAAVEEGELEAITNEEPKEKIILTENLEKRMGFVGNDYTAVESYKYSDPNEIKVREVQILPIDNIENEVGVSIADLSGKEGENALLNSARAHILTLGENEAAQLDKEIKQDSITLARRNGHWIMKGRLYYTEPIMDSYYADYNINIFPPEKVVNYDKLFLSWNQIKTRVPEALDAYTSPNNDIAIIITSESIYVYSIVDNELSNKFLKKVNLKEGETVIMAEWAVGSYVDKWNKVVDDNAKTIQ